MFAMPSAVSTLVPNLRVESGRMRRWTGWRPLWDRVPCLKIHSHSSGIRDERGALRQFDWLPRLILCLPLLFRALLLRRFSLPIVSDALISAGAIIEASSQPASRRVHPWVFLVLYIPFGVVGGYVGVTLAYLLKHAGATVGQVAALSALVLLPHTWKFFWAPVIDSTLSQKKWYVLSTIFTAAGLAGTGFFPATPTGLAVLSKIVFLTALSTTFLGMAIESLLAYCAPEDKKGNTSGWFQAGNLGGGGIGGGLALLLAEQCHAPAVASCAIGILCLLCAFALLFLPTPPPLARKPGFVFGFLTPVKDLWEVVRHRAGFLALILCFLPVGSGAAPFPAIADEWRASAETVALVTGLLGGLISAAGCLPGGWACDKMDRKKAYVWFGILQAASAIAMALLPRTQSMYMLWASVYTFTAGLTYAAFSAFVFEAIGKGAAATKYNALAALSNVPLWYMTNLDGWTHDHWGSVKMFFTEPVLLSPPPRSLLCLPNFSSCPNLRRRKSSVPRQTKQIRFRTAIAGRPGIPLGLPSFRFFSLSP